MDDERGTIKITLPPLPEGAIGQRLFCGQSQMVYPWWIPSWLMRRFPIPLWRWARRLGSEEPRYVELTWQEFVEMRKEIRVNDDVVDSADTDEPRSEMLRALSTVFDAGGKLRRSEVLLLRETHSREQMDLLAATFNFLSGQLRVIAGEYEAGEGTATHHFWSVDLAGSSKATDSSRS